MTNYVNSVLDISIISLLLPPFSPSSRQYSNRAVSHVSCNSLIAVFRLYNNLYQEKFLSNPADGVAIFFLSLSLATEMRQTKLNNQS